jgi:hypothetical protein
MNTQIIRTEGVNLVETIGRFCASAGYASVVRGVPSAGVTTALLSLRDRYPELKLPGTARFYSFSLRDDPAKSLSSALASEKERGGSKVVDSDSDIDRCFASIVDQDIRLLIFDRCHNVTIEGLDRLLDMIELCLQRERPIGFVLGGRNFNHKTLAWGLCDRSKIARTISLPLLDRDQCVSVLKDLSPQFEKFSEQFLAARTTALEVADEIHGMSGGRIGELRKLVDYLSYLNPHGAFSSADIRQGAKELTFPGYGSPQ